MKLTSKAATAISSKNSGFTLVEILVVLAIVAVLAGLLFPAFSRARSAARTATCASNLKQIGLAFRLYVEDYKGFHPSPGGSDPNCRWAEQIYPYAKSTAIFSCPSFDYGEYRPGCPAPEPTNDPNYPNYYWHGSYNLNFLFGSNLRGGINSARIRNPSGMILLTEGYGDGITYSKPTVGSVANPKNPRDFSELEDRHNYGVNVAYADGHVKWKSYEDLLDIKQWQP